MHTDEHASCDRRHVIMVRAIIRIMQPYICMNYYPGCDQLAKASYTTGIKWSTRAKITFFFFCIIQKSQSKVGTLWEVPPIAKKKGGRFLARPRGAPPQHAVCNCVTAKYVYSSTQYLGTVSRRLPCVHSSITY
jgi:hypothetical protein